MMGEHSTENGFCWEDCAGWQMGMDRLSSAFVIASVVSYGLSRKELDVLADYCSLLSHCFRSIAASERYCGD